MWMVLMLVLVLIFVVKKCYTPGVAQLRHLGYSDGDEFKYDIESCTI